MRTTALFVDFDGIDEALRLACFPVAPALLAQNLRRSAKLLTGDLAAFACGSWSGATQTYAETFRQEGYTVASATNGLEAKLACFERQAELLQATTNPPSVYVLVTHDSSLAPLASRLAGEGRDVRIWGLACSAPEVLRDETLQFYSLEELLDLRVRSCALFIDFENLAFCLHDLGYTVDPAVLAKHLRERAAQGRRTVQAFAYADWHRLPPMQDASGRSLSSEAQRILELSSIETRYLISRAGKNTADMKIADDIRTVLQEPNSPNTFIIASGDRDFAPVIETLQRQGKEVLVWGVRGKTSRSLSQVAHIEYIQEFVPLASAASRGAEATALNETTAEASGETTPSLWTPLILLLDEVMSRNNWSWISFSKLIAEANHTGKFGSTEEETRNLVNQAIARGLILRERIANPNPNYPDQFIWACRPNDESRAVQAVRLLPPIALDISWRSVVERGWDYVAFSFLLKELAAIPEIVQAGFGEDDDWRAAWINFLVAEGRLRLERRPHPKNRRDLMKALTLPDQDMLARIIISVDNFCATRNTTWEAASALLQYLACFGIDTVRGALTAGEKYGALRLAKYPHPIDPQRPPTTGITLNPEIPFVARVLERRNALLRTLYTIQERDSGVWEHDIAAVVGERASLWRSILAHERLVRPAEAGHNNGHHFVLSRSHAVVRLACGLPPEDGDGHHELEDTGTEPVPMTIETADVLSELQLCEPAEDLPQDSGTGTDWSTVGPGIFD